MLNLVGRRRLWYAISLLIIIPGTLALIFWHLNLGIDFTGGTVWELQFARTDIQSLDLRQVLVDNGEQDPQVQIGTGTDPTTQTARIGDYKELQLNTVGPTVGASVSKNSIIAVVAASVGILLYLAWAFRKVRR